MAKQDRVFTRTPSALEQKYDFGRKFREAEGRIQTVGKQAQEAKQTAVQADGEAKAARSEILQLSDSISLSVDNGESTAQIKLKVGDREIPATVDMKGLVTFTNLSTAGATQIDGGNIITGIIKSADGSVVIDLDKGTVTFNALEGKITAAQAAADQAKEDAAAAQAAADNAQAVADTAKANAAAAQTAADHAQAVADKAEAEVAAAQTAADDAKAAADAADTKARQAEADLAEAKQELLDVTSRVGVTEEDIAAAQEAVNTAQEAADKAKAEAAAAQTAADTAKANAEAAQTVADKAEADAATAQLAADNAKANADAAQSTADKAEADAEAAQATADIAEAEALEARTAADNAQTAADNAQAAADEAMDAVNVLDTKLDAQEVFNRLTNNGTLQGLFRGEDGNLYFNASYINTGTLLADLIKAGTIKSKDGESVVIDLDKGTASLVGTVQTETESDSEGSYFSNMTPYGVRSVYVDNGKGSYLSPTEVSVWSETITSRLCRDKWEIRPESASEDYANYHLVGQVDTQNGLVLLYLLSKEGTHPLQIASHGGSNYVRGLSEPERDRDAATKGYVDNNFVPAGYAVAIDSLDNATAFGLTQSSAGGPTEAMWDCLTIPYDSTFATQIAFKTNQSESWICVRKKQDGVWGGWEWQNPPMALGVEYRTTERWRGLPVYRKYMYLGVTTAGTVTLDHGITDFSGCLEIQLSDGSHQNITHHGNIQSLYVTGEGVHITAGTAQTIYATIQYTKT